MPLFGRGSHFHPTRNANGFLHRRRGMKTTATTAGRLGQTRAVVRRVGRPLDEW